MEPQKLETDMPKTTAKARRDAQIAADARKPYADKVLALTRQVESLTTASRQCVAIIDAFDRKCDTAEYTDTGEAWETFHDVRNQLSAALTNLIPPKQRSAAA